MKLINAIQTLELDAYTIRTEPISSLALMERAANAFTTYFIQKNPLPKPLFIFCGTGNNGGDGLAVARQLQTKGWNPHVYLLRYSDNLSQDANANLNRLKEECQIPVFEIEDANELIIPENSLVIDAIFGSGITRPIEGFTAKIIDLINAKHCITFSIDMPSGLSVDVFIEGSKIKANYTLAFQLPKLSFLLPMNEEYVGEFSVGDIGLDKSYLANIPCKYFYNTLSDIQAIFKSRRKFSHKGTNGHALIVGGKAGSVGAAILSSKSCLVSGAGLVSLRVPSGNEEAIYTHLPEVMIDTDDNTKELTIDIPIVKYKVVGIGPGIGKSDATSRVVNNFIRNDKTSFKVIDADALNILACKKTDYKHLDEKCILTPHPKEFQRLVGETNNDYDRLEKLITFSVKYGCYVILKGAHTAIASPDGTCYFNSSGNPALSTAGSGDVLTGIITGLLAQGYSPLHACSIGVYIHGLSADLHQIKCSSERMIASDIIAYLPNAFAKILTP